MDFQSIHDFIVKDAGGNDVGLSKYKEEVVLFVNVPIYWGPTHPDYIFLKKLYEQYNSKGFVILVFPCDVVGGQEPGNNENILDFARTCSNAEFPIFDKVDVNGENTAPVYKFLKSSKAGVFGSLLGDTGSILNFTKFLVDKKGKVFERYAPTTTNSIENDIKKLLGIA